MSLPFNSNQEEIEVLDPNEVEFDLDAELKKQKDVNDDDELEAALYVERLMEKALEE